MHAFLHFALELLFIKKLFEFHIFKVQQIFKFCQLTSTDLRNTFIIVPARYTHFYALNHHYILVIQ